MHAWAIQAPPHCAQTHIYKGNSCNFFSKIETSQSHKEREKRERKRGKERGLERKMDFSVSKLQKAEGELEKLEDIKKAAVLVTTSHQSYS